MDNVRLDPRQIRVLAHPLRSRLLGSLRTAGPATATRLARELGTNTGATSYHLRQLAEVGLVTEEERAGGGRERWWQAVHQSSSWRRSQYDDDPDAAAAADWLEAYQVERLSERAAQWRAAAPEAPLAWRDATGISDFLLTIGPERLRELTSELEAVVERHREARPGEAGARAVHVYLGAIPEPPV